MHSKYLLIDVSSDGEVIKNIGKVLPDNSVAIFSLTLHVKAIVLSDGTRLVIATDHGHPLRVLYFQQAQQCDYFYTMCSPVYEIP